MLRILALSAAITLIAGCGEQSAPKEGSSASNETIAAAPKAEQAVNPKDAVRFEGKIVTVCGTVTSARYLGENTGRPGSRNPTFLNFGDRFPNHDFTGVIFEDDREKFGEPERSCLNKSVCITGKIQIFRNKPEIVITEPAQLRGC